MVREDRSGARAPRSCWALLLVTVLPALALAQEATVLDNPPGGRVEKPAPGPRLRSTCTNAVATLEACDATGTCTLITRYPCYPWACDAQGTCEDVCASSAECASGAGCNQATGQCVPVLQQCKDASTLQTAAGSEFSCAPYKCEAAACRISCNAAVDCVQGNQCRGNLCVPAQ